MISKEYIEELTTSALEGTDLFVVEVKVKSGNIITVTIDSETTLTIHDCINLSKTIEKNLDREVEDFELRVTSFGADSPIKFSRQYIKNIGRQLDLTLADGTKHIFLLLGVNENGIEVQYQEGKKKNPILLNKTINFEDITEARVILSFK